MMTRRETRRSRRRRQRSCQSWALGIGHQTMEDWGDRDAQIQ
ncbi:hypothetical protein [Nostoc sp. C052]|nr:hypothetical protein [Nostoc sp. C052]